MSFEDKSSCVISLTVYLLFLANSSKVLLTLYDTDSYISTHNVLAKKEKGYKIYNAIQYSAVDVIDQTGLILRGFVPDIVTVENLFYLSWYFVFFV